MIKNTLQNKIVDYAMKVANENVLMALINISDYLLFDTPDEFIEYEAELNGLLDFANNSIKKYKNGTLKITETICDYENRLIDIASTLYSYMYAIENINQVVLYFNRYSSITTIENNDFLSRAKTEIFDTCRRKLRSCKLQSDEGILKRTIISEFPLRMTKSKYMNYINDFLSNYMLESTNQQIIDISDFSILAITPTAHKSFGKHFSELGEMIKSFYEIDYSSYDSDKLKETVSKLEDLKTTLSCYMNSLNELFGCIRSLHICGLAAPGDVVFSRYTVTKDMVCLFAENDIDSFISMTEDTLDELVCDALDDCMDARQKVLTSLSKTSDLTEEQELSVKMFRLLSELDKNSIEEACLPAFYNVQRFDDIANDSDKKQLINQTTKVIEGFFANVQATIKVKKLLKQYSLNDIDCFMSHNDFFDYLDYSYDQIIDPKEKIMIYDRIMAFLHSEDNFDDDDFEPGDCDHDDSCDCGHDHTH